MIKKQKLLLIAVLVVVFFNLTGCQQKQKIPPQTQMVLGTVCTINLFEQGSPVVYAELFKELRSIEQKMSMHITDSDIAKINKNAGKNSVKISDETFFVLKNAKEYAIKTEGAFDPTIGPLVALWNVSGNENFGDSPKVPSFNEIQKAQNLVDFQKLELNEQEKTAFLQEVGMLLDVGAIAKGYVADVLIAKLRQKDITKATIDLGGNVYVFGEKQKNTPWVVGIRTPSFTEKTTLLSLPLKDTSLVTSGMYERYFEENGKKYHHILDKTTGYPAENDILSVSIVCESSMIADILSTACFVMGKEKALSFLAEEAAERAVEAVIVDTQNKIWFTEGLKHKITVINSDYTLQ